MSPSELNPEERAILESKCQRRVMQNLQAIGRQIGARTRMMQIIADRGVVGGLLSMGDKETSGWNDLYLGGLLGLSVEATIVESAEFRLLFPALEIDKMEDELRAAGYEPKIPT